MAYVKDAEDVSAALRFARGAGLEVAIRGGGHHPAGASSAEDGLVIDLSKYLDKVNVDVDKKLAYVEGGALWKTVDEAGMKYGLATVGGTVNHVSTVHFFRGSAGVDASFHLDWRWGVCKALSGHSKFLLIMPRLTLGGGYGYLTGLHGLVIDNLESVRPFC